MISKIRVKGDMGSACHYCLVAWPLGWVAVVWCGNGIIALYPGAIPDVLASEVTERFAATQASGISDQHWGDQLLSVLDDPTRASVLPLILNGTPFQQQVWQELRRITAGETLTYSQLACRLGRPAAVRAVANACAANQLALVIPCHRVIRSGGKLSGYRWGSELKRSLLDWEAALTGRRGSQHAL